MEYVFPNMQHAALFYKVCALAFPIRLVTMGRAGRTSWPATRTAAVYMLVDVPDGLDSAALSRPAQAGARFSIRSLTWCRRRFRCC